MIEFTRGDLLEADVDALVNTVNCVGHMGRGIALQFKKAWPENFKAYARACEDGEVVPGRVFVYETGRLMNPKFIINFPTKRHWRSKSKLEDVETGLKDLVAQIRLHGIRSIAVPPLGSGLGGLRWGEVRSLVVRYLGELADVDVRVFEPHKGKFQSPAGKKSKAPKMTMGRATLLGLMDQYLRALMDPFVSLLELHKLMYFMQESGEHLKLRFKAAHYGPYAENLRHVLNAIEGHFITGYGAGGDQPDKVVEAVPEAVEQALAMIDGDSDTRLRFERVRELVSGFETPFGLELLATVHWVMTHDDPGDDERLVELVHAWGEGKKQFSSHQVLLAARVLRNKGWVPSEVSV